MRSPRELVPSSTKSRIKITRAKWSLLLGVQRFAQPSLNDIGSTMNAYLPPGGTFLEIGANDGYSQSNTYYLEKVAGWRGILIEPNPTLHGLCESHRKQSVCYKFACVGPNGPDAIAITDNGLESTVVNSKARGLQTIEVPTATLSELIDASPFDRITYMSVDVEGAEVEVLSGLDLDRHLPEFLLVETKDINSVRALLDGHMEVPTAITHHDYLFQPLKSK